MGMEFKDLFTYDIPKEPLIAALAIKDAIEINEKYKSLAHHDENRDTKWTEAFFSNIQPIFWKKWATAVFIDNEIPIYKTQWEGFAPFYRLDDWFDIFTIEKTGTLPISELDQFWTDRLPNNPILTRPTYANFIKDIKTKSVRNLIVDRIIKYFQLETNQIVGWKNWKPRKGSLEGIYTEPGWYFWGLDNVKYGDWDKKSSRTYMKITGEMLDQLETWLGPEDKEKK